MPGIAAGKEESRGRGPTLGTRGARLRPRARLRPAPPSLSPLSSDKAAAAPRSAPGSVSVPPLLLPSPLPRPPARPPPTSCPGSPSIPLSSSSSLLLSPDVRLLRTPSPGSPAACELTQGLQTWGGGVPSLSSRARTSGCLSSLCAEIARQCGHSRVGTAGEVGVP